MFQSEMFASSGEEGYSNVYDFSLFFGNALGRASINNDGSVIITEAIAGGTDNASTKVVGAHTRTENIVSAPTTLNFTYSGTGVGNRGVPVISGNGLTVAGDSAGSFANSQTDAIGVEVWYNTGGTWALQQYFVPSGGIGTGTSNRYASVALSDDGNSLIVQGDVDGVTTFYYYTRSGSTWTEQQVISSRTAFGGLTGDGTGLVLISGTTAYWYTLSGSTFTQQSSMNLTTGKLAGETLKSYKMSGDGTAFFAGQYATGASASWSFQAWTRSGNTWTLSGRTSPSTVGANTDLNTITMATSSTGDKFYISLQFASSNYGSYAPGIFVYTRSGNTWNFTYKMVDGVLSDKSTYGFGLTCSADGKWIYFKTLSNSTAPGKLFRVGSI